MKRGRRRGKSQKQNITHYSKNLPLQAGHYKFFFPRRGNVNIIGRPPPPGIRWINGMPQPPIRYENRQNFINALEIDMTIRDVARRQNYLNLVEEQRRFENFFARRQGRMGVQARAEQQERRIRHREGVERAENEMLQHVQEQGDLYRNFVA